MFDSLIISFVDMDSTILSSADMENLVSIAGRRDFKLIYRASRDSFTASAFHLRCNHKPNTLTIIKSYNGYIFGGYTSATWDGSGYKYDSSAYLFSLKRNGVATKDKIPIRRDAQYNSAGQISYYHFLDKAIVADPNFGPIFGNDDIKVISRSDIYVGSRTLGCSGSSSYFPQCSNAQAYSYMAGSQYNWLSQEIEVFQVDPMLDLNTAILNQNEITSLYSRIGARKFILLYRASIHGFSVEAFHSKCDFKPRTITIIRSNYNSVFAGYTTQTWEGNDYKYDESAFILSLRRKGASSNDRFSTHNPNFAIQSNKNQGPTFGYDIIIRNNSNIDVGSSSNLGHSYTVPSGMSYGSTAAREFLAGSFNTWIATEIEVFQVISK